MSSALFLCALFLCALFLCALFLCALFLCALFCALFCVHCINFVKFYFSLLKIITCPHFSNHVPSSSLVGYCPNNNSHQVNLVTKFIDPHIEYKSCEKCNLSFNQIYFNGHRIQPYYYHCKYCTLKLSICINCAQKYNVDHYENWENLCLPVPTRDYIDFLQN